jgi:hypothetical protein
MDWLLIALTITGLTVFEIVSSVDNAIINADVLATMGEKARRWFLLWGLIFAVFVVRGLLPWLIVWATTPSLGPVGALLATFSSDPAVTAAIEESAPVLLIFGGTFLIFLFLHWLFVEEKACGLRSEVFFSRQAVWFYAIASILLAAIVWFALQINTMMGFSAVLGSTAFFIIHGFRQNAEAQEARLRQPGVSDLSKIAYLEVLDATFSIDGVIGAFAFTLSVPLILIGNGIGAVVVRELTVRGVDRIRSYCFLKNGAMYSILVLGTIMLANSFGFHVPAWLSPVVTFAVVGYFLYRSVQEQRRGAAGVV